MFGTVILGLSIGVALVAGAFAAAWWLDRRALKVCATRGHDFTRGPACSRCETPQPVLTTRKGF